MNQNLEISQNTPLKAPERASLFIMDEQPFVASGVLGYFSNSPEFQVCGQAYSTRDALRHISDSRPDILITEVQFRDCDGLTWIQDLVVGHPKLKIVILTTLTAKVYARRAIRCGAHAFVSKFDDPNEIMKALMAVRRGEIYLPSSHIQDFIRDSTQRGPQKQGIENLADLGDRELHVLKLYGSGSSTMEIAKIMLISHKTVQTHRRNIMIKLGLTNTTKFISFASQWLREQSF